MMITSLLSCGSLTNLLQLVRVLAATVGSPKSGSDRLGQLLDQRPNHLLHADEVQEAVSQERQRPGADEHCVPQPARLVLGRLYATATTLDVEVEGIFGKCAASVRDSSSARTAVDSRAMDAPMLAVGRNAAAASPTNITRPCTYVGARTSLIRHKNNGSPSLGKLATRSSLGTSGADSKALIRSVRPFGLSG